MNGKNHGRGTKCKAGYPKKFQEETSVPEDEYPLNRRQNGQGPRYQWMKKVCSTDICIDNQWVVSYSPFLLYKYQAHFNVEVCSSVKAIKYILISIYFKGNNSYSSCLEFI